ncbi:uncharacterized protein TNCV_1746041 [Trichonephila clavipes]|nr:uncharacterized protein TNCV_1746041 [Trichonephila clavipes]
MLITDFIQSNPGFQECDDEGVETWMTCDAEDCGFQMLNDDEIETSVKESDPVYKETAEYEDNNIESSKGPSNADAFFALEIAMEWYEQQPESPSTQLLLLKRIRKPCREKTKVYNATAKKNKYFRNKGKIVIFCTYFAFSSSTFPACDDIQYSFSVRFHIQHGSHLVFGYPNHCVSEWCPVPIHSDKRHSSV